ncbi:LytR/AlgR family response regulator transcription factor [Sungkyunkwania multivorans]|uniref:LytR/AlgR family response regulator transcription factor n=1 Tax=Sungkyunkwania multivorans TaxID=1173618 RepID=A0ABW3D3K4_9FLAO
MKYTYVIIDNDNSSIEAIRNAFLNFPDYLCKGTAANEEAAVDLILAQSPNLVFIEVEIPGKYGCVSSFGVIDELRKYTDSLPFFIVVTKTEKFALDAIKNDVLDYVLKPMGGPSLRRALCRFEKKNEVQAETVCIRSYGDYRFLNTDDILYLKADNNTTDFFLEGGNKVSAYRTLKYFENMLPQHFVRIHNSYIINSKHISRIHFGKAKCAIKNSKELIPFSKSYKDKVETMKNSLYINSSVFI